MSQKTTHEKQSLRKRFPNVKLSKMNRTAYQFYVSEKALENRDNRRTPLKINQYATQWAGETDRSRWVDLAAKDKIRFIEEVRSHGYEYNPIKSPNKRKKPCGPFVLYARDSCRTLQREMGITYREALKILGTRWKENVDPDTKTRYFTIFQAEKDKYNTEEKGLKE
jgi:hypothetical protein